MHKSIYRAPECVTVEAGGCVGVPGLGGTMALLWGCVARETGYGCVCIQAAGAIPLAHGACAAR